MSEEFDDWEYISEIYVNTFEIPNISCVFTGYNSDYNEIKEQLVAEYLVYGNVISK